jgi:hypothetical protein
MHYCDRTFKITLNNPHSDSKVFRITTLDLLSSKKDFASTTVLNFAEQGFETGTSNLNASGRKRGLLGTSNGNFWVQVPIEFPLGTFGNFWKPNMLYSK